MNFLKKMVVLFVFLWMTVTLIAQEAPRSYYVRADGDDENNNGRSEDTPFKTLTKAVDSASKGAVKTITILGTINSTFRISNADATSIISIVNQHGSCITIEKGGPFKLEKITLMSGWSNALTLEGVSVIAGKGWY